MMINFGCINTGLEGGGAGVHLNKKVFSNNDIIAIQEFSNSGKRIHPNFELIVNGYTGKGGAKKKANQLLIAYNIEKFKLIENVFTNDRIQIIKLNCIQQKSENIEFLVINCHIPQSKQKREYLLKILEFFVEELKLIGIPIIVCGDFNTRRENIYNIGTIFPEKIKQPTTPSGNEIDFITFSNDIQSVSFNIDSDLDGYSKGNHFILNSTLIIGKKEQLQKFKNLKTIYDSCEQQSYEHCETLKYHQIGPYKNDIPQQKSPSKLSPVKESKQPKNNKIFEFTISKFFESMPNKELVDSIFHFHLKGVIDIRTFRKFVENKGEKSKTKTKQASFQAINEYFSTN